MKHCRIWSHYMNSLTGSFLLNNSLASYSSIVLGISCATALIPMSDVVDSIELAHVKVHSSTQSYSTSERYTSHIDALVKNIDVDLALESFYEELYQSQESLGPEFKEALFDNLWDLYES